MRIWRRKRRFKPFDRSSLPVGATLNFDEMLVDGLLVAEAAVRMELRNRFVVDAVRDGTEFTELYARNTTREVIKMIADESNESARRLEVEEEIASGRTGASQHQHDYHHADIRNLRRRSEVQRAIAEQLLEYSQDEAYVEKVTVHARDEAWDEISQAVDSTMNKQSEDSESNWLGDDDLYASERRGRMKTLLGDIRRESKRIDSGEITKPV